METETYFQRMNPLEFIVSTATMAAMLSLGVFIGRATCTHAYHDAVVQQPKPSLVLRSSGGEYLDYSVWPRKTFVVDSTGAIK